MCVFKIDLFSRGGKSMHIKVLDVTLPECSLPSNEMPTSFNAPFSPWGFLL